MLRSGNEFLLRRREPICTAVLLFGLLWFLLSFFAPALLFQDTMTVGGDTPAHNYMASHLKDQLFHHGSIISWADGWWGGFPMFQYYFPLPYFLVVLLDLLLPFNIAFKLVTVLGLLMLPACAWAAGRLLRLPHPAPLFLSIVALLFLFVNTHRMWGANIYSALAGMLANSYSFPLMLLFIASAWRDAEDERFRLVTVLLYSAVIASHFFTSVIGGLTVALIPLLHPRRFRRTALILAGEAGLALLLMAWWLIPLIAKSEYSMDFGENWNLPLLDTFPNYAFWLSPLAVLGLVLGPRARHLSVLLFLGMFLMALGLFYFGFALSPVFVNVRLWPFLFFAYLALVAIGAGLLVRRVRGVELLVFAAAIDAMVYIETPPRDRPQLLGEEIHRKLEAWGLPVNNELVSNQVREWVQWNYGGMESKPYWPTIQKLVLPLDHTPGRLANDLHEDNNALGSSRIFEAVPHLIHKPVLEGGLVNSAIGSMFAYYIQGETSRNCAGFPTIVQPTTFNLTNATRHLTLYNVKHFIAKWDTTKQAMHASPDWKFLGASQGWELFELLTQDGRYVFIPKFQPVGVRTRDWKAYALEWIYTPSALDQPFVLLPPDTNVPATEIETILTDAQFRRYLTLQTGAAGDIMEWLHLGPFPYPVTATNPIAITPIDEARIDPRPGEVVSNHAWQLLFAHCPINMYRYHPVTNYIAYSFVNIFTPEARDAVLHFGNDDHAQLWLNGELVGSSGNTGFQAYRRVPIHLKQGRNRLLHKLQQAEGGCFFHVRLTDANDQALSNVVCTAANAPFQLPDGIGHPTRAPPDAIVSEQLDDGRIRFQTQAIGQPHIVKVSYYPNWKVRGATRVYNVTPSFLLVYPDQSTVELYYGSLFCDQAGRWLTVLGTILLIVLVARRWRQHPGQPFFNRVALLKFIDAMVGLPLCWIFGYSRFLLTRREPTPPDPGQRDLHRILVIRPGGMGDMILLLPLIKRLRLAYPAATLDLVCERRNLPVLTLARLGVDAIAYDARPFHLLHLLFRGRYDLALDTEQFHHFSAIIAWFSRAPIRIGFKINPARNLLYTHLVNYDGAGYEGLQFGNLLTPLGLPEQPYELEGLLRDAPLPDRTETDIHSFCDQGEYIAVYPGSSTPYKNWGTPRFVALLRELTCRNPLRVVLIGGAGDRADGRAILRELAPPNTPIVSAVGRLSLAETATVLRHARLFVGGDSGLAHLAIALGVPTVVLFGPSDPKKWGLTDERHRVVHQSLACSPCFIFGYHKPCRTMACMTGITAEQVLDACEQLLRLEGRT